MKTSSRRMLFVLLIAFSPIIAGEYGNIVGICRGIDNLCPKSSVSIGVVETGDSTRLNEFGEFFIPHVRAGQYSLIVTVYGCGSHIENVTVHADFTTYVELDIRFNPICDPSLMGSMNEPAVVSSKTYSGSTLALRDIEASSADSPEELIRTLPDIVTSEYGLHLRGSTSEDITYYLDGLVFMVPYTTGWQTFPFPLSAVEELSLQSGGMSAEYGWTRAGIVNTVTRQAGNKHHAKIRYSTDELFSGSRLNFGHNGYDVSVSGPLPANLSYYLSGDLQRTDAFQEAKYKIPSPRDDFHGYGKLTYRLPETRGQLSLSGFRAREQWVRWSPYIEPGNDLKYFDQRPMTRTKYSFGMAALDYRLSSKNLTSLRFGLSHYDRCYGNRDYEWEESNGRQWFDDYRFKAEHLIQFLLDEEWQVENLVFPRDLLTDSVTMYHQEIDRNSILALRNNPWGMAGLFYTRGDYPVWSYFQHEDLQIRFDIRQHLSARHELTTGIHYTKYAIRYFDNPLAWALNTISEYGFYEPTRVAYYMQDDIMFAENLIVHAGLRLDRFNPNLAGYAYDTLEPAQRPVELLRVSPRIGIAVPFNNNFKFQLNYEHALNPFFACPSADSALHPESAIQFELITEYGVTKDLTLLFNLYSRRYYDWNQILSDQFDYVLDPIEDDRVYDDEVDVHGALFGLRADPWEFLSMNISYNHQNATGSNNGWYADTAEFLIWSAPADFDRTHHLMVTVNLEFPLYHGYKLLESMESSLWFSYHSGQPYTPTDLWGNVLSNKNSRRMPGYTNVDWKIARRFRIGRSRLVVSALFFNLFNTEHILNVYTTTGDPDDHGDIEPSIDQFGYTSIASPWYSPQADTDHDGLITPVEARDSYVGAITDLYDDPTNYAMPFRVRLGIGIEL